MAKKEIINEIEKLIDSKVESWGKSMPKIEEDIYTELIKLTGELEEINGRIKPSIKNVKTISKIKAILNKVIFDKKYEEDLSDIVKTVDEISKLQNKYFSETVKQFKVPKVIDDVKQLSIDGVIDQLGKNGLDVNITTPLKDILLKNVTSGGTKKEFLEQAKAFITKTEGGEGRLSRYTKQIVTDSLNQYSANYNSIISDDLGFEWFIYSGTNKDTTREFCKAITTCKNLEYIHRSQFNDLLSGKICNEDIPLNKKTGLPNGMIEGTNEVNLITNRGGYNCNHQFTGVPTVIVPKEYQDRIKKKEEVIKVDAGPVIKEIDQVEEYKDKIQVGNRDFISYNEGGDQFYKYEDQLITERNIYLQSEKEYSLSEYKGNAYTLINYVTANDTKGINKKYKHYSESRKIELINDAKNHIEKIQESIKEHKTDRDLVLYRGAAMELPGFKCTQRSSSENGGDFEGNISSLIGILLSEKKFISASLIYNKAEEFLYTAIKYQYQKEDLEENCKIPVLIKMLVPKGTNYVYIDKLGQDGGGAREYEFLLNHTSKYLVLKTEKKKYFKHSYIEIVIQLI